MSSTTNIHDILMSIGNTLSTRIMPILVGLAVLAFLINVIYFIANADNEKDRTTFRSYLINSLIALFILISIWGIVGIGTKTLLGTKPFIPQLRTSD